MRAFNDRSIPFLSPAGVEVARVWLVARKDSANPVSAPLVEIDEPEAREYGETTVQLREAERYEYRVLASEGTDLRLHSKLSTRRKSLERDEQPDAGDLETGSYCGTLLLNLVKGEDGDGAAPVATALLDVRSLKLDYRTEYRGMLRHLAGEMAGLVADARSSAKVGFRSSFEERTDGGWLQIHLELLREVLDSVEFAAALGRIVTYPHERLSSTYDTVRTDRAVRWTPDAVRQLVTKSPRRGVPSGHSLRERTGLTSIAERVPLSRKARDLDTPENRFVKYALGEFLAFLSHAQTVFEGNSEHQVSSALCRRLAASVEDWLGRALFREVGDMRLAPLGSPVLLRKAGYRELTRWWIRFRTAAELSWEAGEDMFRAGQRDVATLYEYWLFFQLLDWFCRTCREEARPDLEELVSGIELGLPALRIKSGSSLGPFEGEYHHSTRRLRARFDFNRRFAVTGGRHEGGSWTRRLHPDYTFTFWPDCYSEEEAEAKEVLVHVHFDAKYRVESIEGLFGGRDSEDVDEDSGGNYKRQDLLKMHAYRDAIKRSQGAYVLYPGSDRRAERFTGFHEVLPGLGAFAVKPAEDGSPIGMDSLELFLAGVLEHLCNRTTAQERLSYHIAESYPAGVKETIVSYGDLRLPEEERLAGAAFRAVPPAEHMVLLAWYRDQKERERMAALRCLYVRLGLRQGAFHVHPNIARTRHVLLRSSGGAVQPGLLALREPGFRVYTRDELRRVLQKHEPSLGLSAWELGPNADDEQFIYALFLTEPDPTYSGVDWDGEHLMDLLERHESDARNVPVANVGRTSAYPRLLPLRDVLAAQKAVDPSR